jgi:hypothetical protein
MNGLCLLNMNSDNPVGGFDSDKYNSIWNKIAPCVTCLIGRFRNVDEMLCFGRWRIVFETCKKIIQNNLTSDQDPHDFDKAILWKAVTSGLDGDPRWRCVCTFFLAAAMEIVLIKKVEGGTFRKQAVKSSDFNGVQRKEFTGSPKQDSVIDKGSGLDKISDHHMEILDLLRRIQQQIEMTHEKIDRTNNAIQNVPVGKPVIEKYSAHSDSDSSVLADLLRNVLVYAGDNDVSRQPKYNTRGSHNDFQSEKHVEFGRVRT